MFVDREEVIAIAGETVTVKCTASATPQARISWYQGQKVITASRRIALSSQGHLVINAVELSDAGYYTCLANNSAGRDSFSIIIQVQSELTIPVIYVWFTASLVWRCSGLLVSALELQPEGQWFQPGLCHRVVSLDKKLCSTLSLSTQVYKWVLAT